MAAATFRETLRPSPPRMDVRIDAARDHELAARVDRASTLPRERAGCAESHDPLAFHADVPCADALGRDDLPTTNDEIQHRSLRYASPNSSAGMRSGFLTNAASLVIEASTAFANFSGPPNLSSVSGGTNLNRMSAVPGGIPTKCTVSIR